MESDLEWPSLCENWATYRETVAEARKAGLIEIESDYETSVSSRRETSELDSDEEGEDTYWVPQKGENLLLLVNDSHVSAEEMRRLREDNRLLSRAARAC